CLAPPAQIRTCSFPAYGSYLGCLTRASGSVPGACFAGPHSPWSPPLAPPAPQRMVPLCSSASRLLWQCPTSHARIIGYGSSPSRCGPRTFSLIGTNRWQEGNEARTYWHCGAMTPGTVSAAATAKCDDSAGQGWHDCNWGKPWSRAAKIRGNHLINAKEWRG